MSFHCKQGMVVGGGGGGGGAYICYLTEVK